MPDLPEVYIGAESDGWTLVGHLAAPPMRPRPPTPLERALDILRPHPRNVPLYRPTA